MISPATEQAERGSPVIVPAQPSLTHIHFFGGPNTVVASDTILGGKGYSLAMMSKAGLPVPPGFTISAECCRTFHAEKKWPDALAAEVEQAVGWLEAMTHSSFGAGERPLLVAVRSGAAVSMPGMMDSVLNVGLRPEIENAVPGFWDKYRDFIRHYAEIVAGVSEEVFEKAAPGKPSASKEQAQIFLKAFREAAGREFPTDPREMIREAINAVFNSWNSERAVKYRQRNNVRNLPGTAVNVQSMCPSELSGVLFTEDPNQPEARRILIEGTVGLGEALVLGHVEPDVFVIDRTTMKVVERSLSDVPHHLSDAQIDELAQLGMNVEKFFGFPVDIEWGHANGKFSLLQSRKIRGLDIGVDVPIARADEIERLKRKAGEEKTAWALHNLGETLPAPTPLTWDFIGNFMNRGGFITLYKDLGFMPSARVQKEGFLELICGKIYANAQRAGELFYDDYPLDYDLSEGKAEQLLGPPSKFNFERAGGGFLLKLPYFLFKMWRSGKIQRKLASHCIEDFEQRYLPAFLEYSKKARAKKLSELSDAALLAELEERDRIALNDFGAETLKPGFLAAYFHDKLSQTFQQVFGKEEGSATLARLLRGLDGDKTVEINIALYEVACGRFSMHHFLENFGHRAVNEFELAEKRWREDNNYLQQIISNYKRAESAEAGKPHAEPSTPKELHEKQRAEREQAERQLSAQLKENGASSLEEEILSELRLVQRYLPYRETGKHYFMMAIALLREVLEEFAERFDLGKDAYFLHREELAQFATRGEELRKTIVQRKIRWQAFQRVEVPEVVYSDKLDAIGRATSTAKSEGGVLEGVGVSAGIGTGTARIVRSPSEAGDLGTGYVLVCPTTDPSWAPLFVHARGLVVERGGVLSHGAIVARDFGIPAVVLKNASKLIPNRASVKVDGNKGRVEVIHAGGGKTP
ncbi:MAG TPA: PEP/pyruvate-binding domain-containing protein [Planctomycetota bacterium]|nr:PEP/pyruvate-binding domain-containing protein [Planctomycetota bacterium]